ncbi:MAG: phosphatase PAP2 family protein [Bacteroidota bacterium]|jgi:membrane-associated phospholipid phosphatase
MKRFPFLSSADFVTLVFVLFLIVLQTIVAGRIDNVLLFIPLNILLCLIIFTSARHVHRFGKKSNTAVLFIRHWYLVPCILIVYTQASSMSYPIHQRDYDDVLIMIDRTMFGVNPTQWISQFAHPIITEILQISYSAYYLFFIALFYELYRRQDTTDFHSGAMLVVYGFYLSYIGYLLLPAIGPRFTLHNFYATDAELPGLFLTEYLRAFINSGGGVPAGAADPAAFVHRDAFPSGHTQLTLVAMYIAFTAGTKIRWWLFVVGSLLIISTVYLRYHYAVDVLAGMLFFLFTIWSGKKIDAWWNEKIEDGK